MGTSVRGALNRGYEIGIDTVTSSANITALITSDDLSSAGFNMINEVSLLITNGACYLFPSIGNNDVPAADITATNTTFVATNVGRFAVGDWLYFYEPGDYTTFEFRRITAIVTATSTITVHAAFTNSYAAATAKIYVVSGYNGYVPVQPGFIVNQSGVNWTNLYIRRMSATNSTVEGYAVVV